MSISLHRNQFSYILIRHVVPCRLSSSDLASLEDGSVLRTNLQGFTITVSQNGSVSEVNGAPVVLPEIYQNDWLVVHGIGEVLELQQNPKEVSNSSVRPTPTRQQMDCISKILLQSRAPMCAAMTDDVHILLCTPEKWYWTLTKTAVGAIAPLSLGWFALLLYCILDFIPQPYSRAICLIFSMRFVKGLIKRSYHGVMRRIRQQTADQR